LHVVPVTGTTWEVFLEDVRTVMLMFLTAVVPAVAYWIRSKLEANHTQVMSAAADAKAQIDDLSNGVNQQLRSQIAAMRQQIDAAYKTQLDSKDAQIANLTAQLTAPAPPKGNTT
jgi:outer membrane murein-binding lipoprotein Lpp